MNKSKKAPQFISDMTTFGALIEDPQKYGVASVLGCMKPLLGWEMKIGKAQ